MVEWKLLTPEQRDRLIAEKVMGWVPKECDGEIGEKPVSPDGWFCRKCGVSGYWGDEYVHEERPRRYSKSIERALTAAESLATPFKLYRTRDQWYLCEIFTATYKSHLGTSKHAAEAICIAALRFRGIEVSDA